MLKHPAWKIRDYKKSPTLICIICYSQLNSTFFDNYFRILPSNLLRNAILEELISYSRKSISLVIFCLAWRTSFNVCVWIEMFRIILWIMRLSLASEVIDFGLFRNIKNVKLHVFKYWTQRVKQIWKILFCLEDVLIQKKTFPCWKYKFWLKNEVATLWKVPTYISLPYGIPTLVLDTIFFWKSPMRIFSKKLKTFSSLVSRKWEF